MFDGSRDAQPVLSLLAHVSAAITPCDHGAVGSIHPLLCVHNQHVLTSCRHHIPLPSPSCWRRTNLSRFDSFLSGSHSLRFKYTWLVSCCSIIDLFCAILSPPSSPSPLFPWASLGLVSSAGPLDGVDHWGEFTGLGADEADPPRSEVLYNWDSYILNSKHEL